MPNLDFRNTNALWSSALVETLVRCGVTQAVISPGSRSTPLTFALVRHPGIEALSVLDERSAAFLALGLAKRQRRPVVLLCTSGTAGANYFPAVIEARESGVPLLVITADRPPELRECASGQTIDQQKLFGSYVHWYHELAVPEPTLARLRYLRQMVSHACSRTLAPFAGPVHLNAPFRDPLVPVADSSTQGMDTAVTWPDFFSGIEPPRERSSGRAACSLPAASRGIVIAGPYFPPEAAAYRTAVLAASRALGWPVLADGLSPLRQAAGAEELVVATYDCLVRNPRLSERLRPEAVLCLGGYPISKPLRAWLERCDAETLLVTPEERNLDGLHGRVRTVVAAPIPLLEHWAASPRRSDAAYLAAWKAAEIRVRAALTARLEALTEPFEGKVAYLLARHLPPATPLMVANSMPVRDLEYFWLPQEREREIYYNRGANGIDGTLSTALGLAHGGRPTVLLTGDLALLHDSNGFLHRPRLRGSLTVVLINNRGGGIFEHLPVAQFDPPFEQFWGTPQEVDFAGLSQAYGVEHVRVRDWAHLVELVSVLPATGLRVLEVRTDRKRDAAYRQTLFAELAASLDEGLVANRAGAQPANPV